MFSSYTCKVGDVLYFASVKKNKVFEFEINKILISKTDCTVCGYIYGYGTDKKVEVEMNLQYLNEKRVFSNKKLADNWLKNEQNKKESKKRNKKTYGNSWHFYQVYEKMV